MEEYILSPNSKSRNLLPWKVCFVVQFKTQKYGLTFHPSPKSDTGNGVYAVSLLEIPKHEDPKDRGPAEIYNESLRSDQEHLSLRPGLYLTHLNDIHLLNMPCDEVIKQLKTVKRPVKLRFVDVSAGTVSIEEIKKVIPNEQDILKEKKDKFKEKKDKYKEQKIISSAASLSPSSIPASPRNTSNGDLYKIVLIGSAGVGKSSLLNVCIKGNDNFDERLPSTLQPEFGSINIPAPGSTKSIQVRIWDTAGQERYQAITRSHYRRADGAILVYDVSDLKSFELAQKWLLDLQETAGESLLSVLLIENKIDLLEQVETGKEVRGKKFVNSQKIKEFCSLNQLLFARTTAKRNAIAHKWEGTKIMEAIKTLVLHIHTIQLEKGRRIRQEQQIQLQNNYQMNEKNNSCTSCL